MGTKRLDIVQTGFDVMDGIADGTITPDELKEATEAIDVQLVDDKIQLKKHKPKLANQNKLKSIKVKLNNGKAGGIYILLKADEVAATKSGETKVPSRDYKLEVTAEVVYNNMRCRGKFTTNIPKGTSLTKAVDGLQGRKQDMIDTLRSKGTLKVEKIVVATPTKSRIISELFDSWLNNKRLSKKKGTIKTYKFSFESIRGSLGALNIDEITIQKIQNEIIEHTNRKRKLNTIRTWMQVLKQVLTYHDVLLNWKKIELPKDESVRKYKHDLNTTREIVEVLTNYPHPIARGVFTFLLSGRRITETLYLEHGDIDYVKKIFTIRAELAKTNREFKFTLTHEMEKAIKIQGTKAGRIFRLEHRQMLEHFKKAVYSIGVFDMVAHDLRSMVAQTALDAGASLHSVSTMLAHVDIATTQKRYVEPTPKHAEEALNTFREKLLPIAQEIIDTEVVVDEGEALKVLYPDATDEQILQVIEVMK
jgi:integrase